MTQHDLFLMFGIKIQDLVAGFGGGLVNALLFQRARPIDAVASVVAGALTANYMAGYFAHVTGLDAGPAGFIVGLTAMAICQGILGAVRKWTPGIINKGDGI